MSNTHLQWCKLCHAEICFINGLGNTFLFYLFIYFCVCACFLIAFGLIWTHFINTILWNTVLYKIKKNTHINLIWLSAPFFITHCKTKTVSNLLTSHHLFLSNNFFDSNATHLSWTSPWWIHYMFWGKRGCCHWYPSPGQQSLQNPLSTSCSHRTSWQSNGMSSSPLCLGLWWQTGLLCDPQWRWCLLLHRLFQNSSPPVSDSISAVKGGKGTMTDWLLVFAILPFQ